jgi:hypothetical protein
VATTRSGRPDVPRARAREVERLDPTDTGVMAMRRLVPFVSEEEEGEYQRYSISQPQPASCIPLIISCYSIYIYIHFLSPPALRFALHACVRACFLFRYIDQILGLLDDDDESGSGPGSGDLEVYERAVSFLSGNVEPTSDLDDVSIAYLQIPHQEMEGGEYSCS